MPASKPAATKRRSGKAAATKCIQTTANDAINCYKAFKSSPQKRAKRAKTINKLLDGLSRDMDEIKAPAGKKDQESVKQLKEVAQIFMDHIKLQVKEGREEDKAEREKQQQRVSQEKKKSGGNLKEPGATREDTTVEEVQGVIDLQISPRFAKSGPPEKKAGNEQSDDDDDCVITMVIDKQEQARDKILVDTSMQLKDELLWHEPEDSFDERFLP